MTAQDLRDELRAASLGHAEAAAALTAAREQLHTQIRDAVAGGMSRYRAAQLSGLSNTMIQKLNGGRRS